MFTAQPKNRGVVDDVAESMLAIFSPRTLGKTPVAVTANLTSDFFAPGAGGASANRVVRSASQFIATGVVAGLATSPDGEDNWIVRTMPTSHPWLVGTAGANCLAVSTNSVDTAKSTDGGVTWTASGNLPAAPDATEIDNIPIEIGGRWIVMSLTGTVLYTSTDLGATWSSQTLPTTNGSKMFRRVGPNFWFWSASTLGYYSTTGLTGSWAAQGMGATPASTDGIWDNPGEDAIYVVQGTNNVIKTVDGVTWTDTGTPALVSGKAAHVLDSARVSFEAETAHSFLGHGAFTNRAYSRAGTLTSMRVATDGAGTFVTPHAGGMNRITLNAPIGVFR